MKKINIKSILLLSILFLQTATLKAQDDLTKIYGVYIGKATTEIETAGGSMKQPGERKFQVEIVKRANDTKLILKDYKLGNYEFEEIVFDNFDQYYQPEKKGWNFFTDPLSGKYFKTKDNIYTIQLWGNPIDDYCFVYENGTMDFTFEIYTNPERKACFQREKVRHGRYQFLISQARKGCNIQSAWAPDTRSAERIVHCQ